MADEVWVLTLRARPSAVPVRSRINQVLKYAGRRQLRCTSVLCPPDPASSLTNPKGETMIKPTLGRIVWFTPHAAEAMTTEIDGRCAAIIVKVWSHDMVNLAVFDANGETHAKTSVRLVQEGHPKPEGHFCEWPPYLIGQAMHSETGGQTLAAQ